MCPEGGCRVAVSLWVPWRGGRGRTEDCQYNIILKPLSDYLYGHDSSQGHVSRFVQNQYWSRFQNCWFTTITTPDENMKRTNECISFLIKTFHHQATCIPLRQLWGFIQKLFPGLLFVVKPQNILSLEWLHFESVNTEWWKMQSLWFWQWLDSWQHQSTVAGLLGRNENKPFSTITIFCLVRRFTVMLNKQWCHIMTGTFVCLIFSTLKVSSCIGLTMV